jgi:predicted ferric reductase
MNTQKRNKLFRAGLFVLFLAAMAYFFYGVFGKTDFNSLTPQAFLYNLSQFTALTGFFFLSLLIISGDFARLFDNVFGLDKIIKTQRKFSMFTYFIVFSHPLIIIFTNNPSLKSFLPNFSLLPFAAGTIALYLFAGIMISSLLYKRISYKTWQWLHFLTYALFFLAAYHFLNVGSHAEDSVIKFISYLLIILVAIGMIYRTSYKIRQRKNKFVVKEITSETHDTFTLVVEPNRRIDFRPGQFFFLRIEGKNLNARHPFSVSNSPSEKYLRFTIKDTGRFTKEAKNLKQGDELKIEGPFGKFILSNADKELVFIAGGVGITPFMSMIADNLQKESKRKITLLYGSKTEKDIIFKKELDAIKGDWFKKIYVLSEEKKKNYDYGRIEEDFITRYVKDFKNKKFYICGPKPMMENVKKVLLDKGVKKEDIVIEDFFW